MPPKKQKSGYQKVKTKDKKLLEAAATAVHQKSIQECFRKHDQKYGSSLGNSGTPLKYNSDSDPNFRLFSRNCTSTK